MIVDIAKARATIARMRTEGFESRDAAEACDGWWDALDALEAARTLADAGGRAVDVLEEQGTRAVKMLRDFIALVPDKPLRMVALAREEFPELFGDEDGGLMYLDEARRRILAKVNP